MLICESANSGKTKGSADLCTVRKENLNNKLAKNQLNSWEEKSPFKEPGQSKAIYCKGLRSGLSSSWILFQVYLLKKNKNVSNTGYTSEHQQHIVL